MAEGLRVEDLVAAAGDSLGAAQGSITGGTTTPAVMALADTTLELKVSVASDGEALRVQPVDAKGARTGALSVGALSTVTVRFVPVAATLPAEASAPGSREKAVAVVRDRDDVQRLSRVVGDLAYEAAWVPARGSWLVTARDPKGRVVRESVVDPGQG